MIDYLHQDAYIIITTNKSPDEWAKMLDDEVLATAILDRILLKSEVNTTFYCLAMVNNMPIR